MGDDWLAGENIDVDIQKLDDFAAALMDELAANFRPSFDQGVLPMLEVRAPFGTGGMNEGMYFRDSHEQSRTAITALLAEVGTGLASLSVAAKSISAGYLTEDALAEATNDDVLRTFSNLDSRKSLDQASQPGHNEQADSTDPRAEARLESVAADLENEVALNGGSDDNEGTSALGQPETVGVGSAAYQIQGDDEGMYGDDVAPADIDLRG